jgi:aryl sulfotransferase
MMSFTLPPIIHPYQNHTLDSTHWERYSPRADDIIIATSYKSGTTWMQEIVRRLIFWGQPDVAWRHIPLSELSPWLDLRVIPLDKVFNLLEAQQHRRFIKSHLALDGLPYYPQVKQIVVGRDVRGDRGQRVDAGLPSMVRTRLCRARATQQGRSPICSLTASGII